MRPTVRPHPPTTSLAHLWWQQPQCRRRVRKKCREELWKCHCLLQALTPADPQLCLLKNQQIPAISILFQEGGTETATTKLWINVSSLWWDYQCPYTSLWCIKHFTSEQVLPMHCLDKITLTDSILCFNYCTRYYIHSQFNNAVNQLTW